MRCKFPIFINGTIALHVSGSVSAHHQERYQAYNGFGTIYAETLEVNKGHWLCECNGVKIEV